ncbi:MFS transporter [Sulfolobus sp. A20-N-F6]|uniref:MFS transporter n=1 Tax=Sulfolobaceae TaxID=118883 RepID=UPI0008460AA0|nr:MULTISPECIES: MFS transporter [unclassified Sulfolobus]TRM82052.1 MFS transporter [Sulfolobus sp. D5]TRM83578.1 MFS transporter [Sulfolobus sp. A20-N-F6]TRM95311.1 MFS transporter [Sulfolobus sp. A20-N-G8]TRN03415.1 MFS transporter [Sulfolobus sp. F1]TRM97326.1 MFS transporter [Sulfolobus sp. B1]
MPSPFQYKAFRQYTTFSVFAGFSYIQSELTTYWLFFLLFKTEPLLFGSAVIARPLFRIFISYFIGFLSDKYNRAKLFFISRGISASLAIVLALAFLTKSPLIIFLVYYIRILVAEISNNVGYVTYYATMPDDARAKAILYVNVISMSSRIISGAVWYILFNFLNAYDLILVGLVSGLGLIVLKGFNIGGGSKRVKLSTGIDYMKRDEKVRGVILTYAISEGFLYPITYILPLLITLFRGTTQIYGFSQAIYYFIFILSIFVMTKLHNGRNIMIIYLTSCFMTYLLLLSPSISPYLLLASLSFISFSQGVIENFVMAGVKSSTGNEFLGSVLSIEILITSSLEVSLVYIFEYLLSVNYLYFIILGISGVFISFVLWLLHPKLREINP